MKEQIESVYIAKGIAIALVVIGHYSPATSPEYWIQIRKVIYSFHMPLFFMLSGYLYGFSPPSLHDYPNYLRKKAKRLLIPFVSISLLYFVVKIVAGLYIKLQFPVSLNSLISIFISPLDSYLPLLWFIYTLFIIFAIFPFICCLVKYNLILLLIPVMFIYLYGFKTNLFCLSTVFYNLPAFTVGFITAFLNINIDRVKTKSLYLILFLSIILFTTLYIYKDTNMINKLYINLLIYILGSTVCVAISVLFYMSNYKIVNYLKIMGIYSMSIYLLHTLFSSTIRIIFSQLMVVNKLYFLCEATIAVLLGIILPLILEKNFLRKHQITKRLFLGLD